MSLPIFVSPQDAEWLLQHSIELLTEHIQAIKKAKTYCEKVASLKEAHERSAFLALAAEYQQLMQTVFSQLKQLQENVV